jgi:hypothetical protein
MPTPKKLIEVALPLDAINQESAREKSIRHGHPSTLHLWWARRPLAACRAVLFASLVDDPASHPEQFPTEEAQNAERQRLFEIIERLVKWENINNEQVLNEARAEIRRATGGNPPPVYDPFAGGGSIPLEAQRLGLEAHASDLNPVAVLINKALIELPPKFANQPPVNPEARQQIGATWRGGPGCRCALLRPVDARRGRKAYRAPLPEGEAAARLWRRRGDRDRLAVGAHRDLLQPGLRGADAAGALVLAIQKKRARSLVRASNRPGSQDGAL